MGTYRRADYSAGWVPSFDSQHAPSNGALRFDNLVLDELGVVALRRGSSKINSSGTYYDDQSGDKDIHSIYSVVLGGTQYRYLGVSNRVKRVNASGVGSNITNDPTFNGSNDIAMIEWLDQVFMARGTSQYKDDGSTARKWGIAMSGTPIRSISAATSNVNIFATCNSGESPGFVLGATGNGNEGTAGAVANPPGRDGSGSGNGAFSVIPAVTGRAVITKTFSANTDFEIYGVKTIYSLTQANPTVITVSAGHGFDTGDIVLIKGQTGTVPDINGEYTVTKTGTNTFTIPVNVTDSTVTVPGTVGIKATDNDTFEMWVYATNPSTLVSIKVMIDVNSGAAGTTEYIEDYFEREFFKDEIVGLGPDDAEIREEITLHDYELDQLEQTYRGTGREREAITTTSFRKDAGWVKLRVKRYLFKRIGATTDKGWDTVRSIRVVATTTDLSGTLSSELYFDDIRIRGGKASTLTGDKSYYYAYVYNSTTYQAISPLSDLSSVVTVDAQGVTVTIPADSIRDSQVNEIWLYRNVLGVPYRVAVDSSLGSVGATESITDPLSDVQAITTNVKAKINLAVPPDGIIDMAGPYFDRLYALTQDKVYISDVHAPDNFNLDHVINVGDAGEECYWIEKAPGGIFVGTSEDIYLITGDGTDLPDGTLSISLRPLEVGYPPRSLKAVVNDEGKIIYLAHDGWRKLNSVGGSERIVTGAVELLYEQHTRHGVSPVNIDDNASRFRAAVAGGIFTAITPEGSDTTDSAVLHRKDLTLNRWYRHTYGSQDWRAIHREPDGTLIASDDAGFLWKLDTGTLDGTSDISVVFWTVIDDNGEPFRRKDPQAYRARLETGPTTTSDDVSIALHVDANVKSGDSASKILTVAAVSSGDVQVITQSISDMAAFKVIQQRITASTNVFRWFESQIEYLDRPALTRALVQPKGSVRDKLYSGVTVRFCALGVSGVIITPLVDGNAVAPTTFTYDGSAVDADVPQTVTFAFTSVSEGKEVSISFNKDVEIYDWEPESTGELPTQLKAWENKPMQPSSVRRRFGGLNVQIDSGGAAATVTPVLDGTNQTALSVTKSALLGASLTFDGVIGRDLWATVASSTAFRVFGVAPIILETFPPLFKGATKEENLGSHARKAFSGVTLKLCTQGSAVTVTVTIDDTDQSTTFSVTTGSSEPDTIRHEFTSPIFGTDIALSFSADVELWEWTPTVMATLPMPFKGRTLETDAGHGAVKTITGVHLKLCTLAVAVSITPVIDGVNQASHSVTTGADEPDHTTLQFAVPVTGTELALLFDSNVELYEAPSWQVSSIEPVGTKVWDSGPIIIPGVPYDRIWIYEYQLTANAGGDLTFTPYFDGASFTAVVKIVSNAGREGRHDVPIGRGYHGRTPRLRVTSSSAFMPYWLNIIYRVTGEMERRTHSMQVGQPV